MTNLDSHARCDQCQKNVLTAGGTPIVYLCKACRDKAKLNDG